MLPLSVFIIARNEADRIGEAIRAVRGLSDDIVLVEFRLDGRHSGRCRGPRSAGHRARLARLRAAKRFAEEQCRHVWMLNVDPDEVVPEDLADEIRSLFEGTPRHDAYRIKIAEMFPGETVPHPIAYALAPVRLYRRDRGRYSASLVHDRVDLAPGASVGRLKGTIHHRSVRSLGDQIAKLNRYSDQQAVDLEIRGVSIPTWRLFFEFPAAFVKAYIGRRPIVRGTYGFLTAMNYAISRHLRLAKHYERRRRAQDARRSP